MANAKETFFIAEKKKFCATRWTENMHKVPFYYVETGDSILTTYGI